MATLTWASTFFRKTFTRIILAVLAIILFFIIINFGKNLINSIFPPSNAPATVAFGKLPKLDLSGGVTYAPGTIFNVQTVSGNIPNLAASAKVFMVSEPRFAFGALKQAQEKAKNAGFNSQPVEALEGKAKFVDLKDKSRILVIETATGNFELQSDFASQQEIIASRPKSQEDAKRQAIDFFRIFGISQKDFPQDKISSTFYKVDAGKLVSVVSLSDANLVQVVFNRAEIDGLPVIYLNAANPSVWALVSNQKIAAANYFPIDIQKNKFATYPLKNASAAFEDLKNARGVFNKKIDGKVFIVRNVKLGYLQTNKFQPHLMPVYIFESDNGLAAYVSAVSDLWVQ